MSELVSAETAREMLSWWEPGELAGSQAEVARDYGTIYAAAPDLAETVIAQAEQIKRLQGGMEHLDEFAVDIKWLISRGVIRASDMEEQ